MALYLGGTKISSIFTIEPVVQTAAAGDYLLLKDTANTNVYKVYIKDGELYYEQYNESSQ